VRPFNWAILRTAVFAVLFMGTVLVYVPYLLIAGEATGRLALGAWRYLGVLPLAAGVAGVAWCLRDFSVVGRGTPAPFDPPRQLVVTGLYRYVRNPMYVSALLLLLGEAVLLEAPVLLGYAAGFAFVAHLFVVLYEEPTLRRLFGESYERYRQSVPRWLPRKTNVTR
jgi:protein-S-isoprenylcysteine O-methyltransferase Ste14